MPKSQSCLHIQLPKRPYRPDQRSTQASQHANLKIRLQYACSTCRPEKLCYGQFAVLENSKIIAYICLKCSLISIKSVPIEQSLPTPFILFSASSVDAAWIKHRNRSGLRIPPFIGSSYSSQWLQMELILLRWKQIKHRNRSDQGIPSFDGSSYSSQWLQMDLILLRLKKNSSRNF